ncbi:endonuclease I [Stackebrandtia albiflava]|uniref:Endonuclease I n=1 Tax=Stackebrandtia albiflava TaxID=406432 RepID=A0A562V2K0_9ACTN|nr:endonuclease [Stackebrandtia albiflava]TWJ12063.1 endonuclease I [Stackebrandtia albiflava]
MRLTRKGVALTAGLVLGSSMVLAPIAFAAETTDAPADYYAPAEGKTGQELKAALHDIIDDHTTLSYSEVKTAIPYTDADPATSGNVILLYTGRSEPNGGDWNREHVWAKSHGDFGTAIGPGTDLHHLRPTDMDVNSSRGNLDFDNGGEELDIAPGNYRDGDSFEPRDEVKGDVARMILYMTVRYEGDDSHPDLEPNDDVENGSAPFHGRLSVLMDWSRSDPPDAFEKNRNEVIFDRFQHNRNPFIDHPEWVDAIWGDPTDPPTDPTDPPTDPTDPPAECGGTSTESTPIGDNRIVTSDIAVSGCPGAASSASTVSVEITHPDRGELSIYLYAPDGSYYVLKRNGDSGANLSETYTVDLDTEDGDGTWTLSVKDYASGNTGTIDSWSLDLA